MRIKKEIPKRTQGLQTSPYYLEDPPTEELESAIEVYKRTGSCNHEFVTDRNGPFVNVRHCAVCNIVLKII